MTRDATARYSFLLTVPAVFGSGSYQLFRSLGTVSSVGWGATALATGIAFVLGYGIILGLFEAAASCTSPGIASPPGLLLALLAFAAVSSSLAPVTSPRRLRGFVRLPSGAASSILGHCP